MDKNDIFYHENDDRYYEYCPKCDANLSFQKGYSNDLPYWVCRGCGETLINPDVNAENDIVWICDKCSAMLNVQEGFTNDCGEWKCLKCGYLNKIDSSEMYGSEDEFVDSLINPYKGLSDEEVLALSIYEDLRPFANHPGIFLVQNRENGELYVKKYLKEYDLSIYKFLSEHPVDFMPRIEGVYESSNNLVIIEEYIQGKTIAEILDERVFTMKEAVEIAVKLCKILKSLHGVERTIIHRDIKPSNIILKDNKEVYLLDVNAAKWYNPSESEDTRLFGTLYYAAPEQFGYGFESSTEKTDVYSVGVLLNVMITGKMPKEELAEEPVRNIIEKCISLEAFRRFSTDELIAELERIS